MSRAVWPRLALTALVAAALLGTWTPRTLSGRPGDEPVAAAAPLEAVAAPPNAAIAADRPAPRFGFSSVLQQQQVTSVAKVLTSINGAPVANPQSAVLRPGDEVIFTVSGFVQNGEGADVADAYDASLAYRFDTGDCFSQSVFGITVTLPVRPANVGDVLICSPVLFGVNQSFSFDITFDVTANAPPHTDPNFNVACVENTAAPNVFGLCRSVAGTIASPTPTATATVLVPTPTPVPAAPVVPAPLLPPPPPIMIPPPPPPIIPMAPVTASRRVAPEVPIIPEADSLVLVLGGLAALGLLVARRARRPGRDHS